MSYYATYSLQVKGCKDADEFEKLVDTIKEMDLIGYAFEDSSYWQSSDTQFFNTYDSCHWYDRNEDMKRLAKTFPNLTFCLSGSEEDGCDIWKTYYHEDKQETCEAIIPPPKRIKW